MLGYSKTVTTIIPNVKTPSCHSVRNVASRVTCCSKTSILCCLENDICMLSILSVTKHSVGLAFKMQQMYTHPNTYLQVFMSVI